MVHEKFFDNYCGSYKVCSVTPKRLLKTNFCKKRQSFQRREIFDLAFSLIAWNKLQGTIDKGPQGILTITLEFTWSILLDLKGRCKHKFLKKRQSFHWRKILAYFFWLYRCDKPQGTNYKGPQCVLTNVEVTRSFWPIFDLFFHIVECDKPQATIYRGSRGILPITVQVTRSFL